MTALIGNGLYVKVGAGKRKRFAPALKGGTVNGRGEWIPYPPKKVEGK